MLYQSTCVGFGYGLYAGAISWNAIQKPGQSSKTRQQIAFVTSSRPRTIDLVPISYGSRPRLRGRLTLRGLTLRRNPWTFGDRVSHSVCRYSCQHSHFRYLQKGSPRFLRRPTERSATDQFSVVSRQFAGGAAWSEVVAQAGQHAGDLAVFCDCQRAAWPGVGVAEIGSIAAPQLAFIGRAQTP